MGLREHITKNIKESNLSKRDILLLLIPGMATVIYAICNVIFSILSFFNIPHANDLFNVVNVFMNNSLHMYNNFNIDLKIILWSFIDLGVIIVIYTMILKKINKIENDIEVLCNEVNTPELYSKDKSKIPHTACNLTLSQAIDEIYPDWKNFAYPHGQAGTLLEGGSFVSFNGLVSTAIYTYCDFTDKKNIPLSSKNMSQLRELGDLYLIK